MTVTDLDQLEREHPALLAMHQRVEQEATTLRARVAELEGYLDAAMRNGVTTERARLELVTRVAELERECDEWEASDIEARATIGASFKEPCPHDKHEWVCKWCAYQQIAAAKARIAELEAETQKYHPPSCVCFATNPIEPYYSDGNYYCATCKLGQGNAYFAARQKLDTASALMERYKAALEWYADPKNNGERTFRDTTFDGVHESSCYRPIDEDEGDVARTALERQS